MARGKRWTVPFESLNGVACRVDIYDDGWAGSVTTLLGADNPFYYQEDDDADMLETIRYRTGYLRLICREEDDFSALYPTLNTDRYIEFYYGNTLDFNGFIQAQDFGTDYAPTPYVVELPVMSPLGLASGTYFAAADFNPPSWKSIRQVIAASLGALNANFDGFVFPQYINSNNPAKITNLFLNSLAFCPFSDKFDKSNPSATPADVYNPKSVEEALNMICTGFGLILHDVPGRPVFQRIDYTGNYVDLNFSSSYEILTPQEPALDDIATIAGDEGETSTVMPLADIKVGYGGDSVAETMNFSRCRGDSRGSSIDNMELVTNIPAVATGEFTFPNVSAARPSINIGIDANGKIDTDTVALAAYGEGSLSEAILFRPGPTTSPWGSAYHLFTCVFYHWNGETSRLRFTHNYGESITNLDNPTPVIGSKPGIAVRISTGEGNSIYRYTSSGWTQNTWSGYSKQWVNGESDCEIGISQLVHVPAYPLVVEFYSITNNASTYMHAISDLRIELFNSATQEYLYKNNKNYKNEYTIRGNGGNEHGDVTRGSGIFCPGVNRIRYGSTITGADFVNISNMDPKYPYMLVAQRLLKLPVKLYNPVNYYDKYTVWGDDSTQWRLIARSFEPWNDKTTLLLHTY